jgi:hypothetical protein
LFFYFLFSFSFSSPKLGSSLGINRLHLDLPLSRDFFSFRKPALFLHLLALSKPVVDERLP